MITNKLTDNIRALCDLHTPWTAEQKALMDKVYGMGPLEPNAKERQPYDELYVKQKASRDYWRRS